MTGPAWLGALIVDELIVPYWWVGVTVLAVVLAGKPWTWSKE